MKSIIYYFSSTGNSLKIALDIANGFDKCDLVSIPGLVNEELITLQHENVGFVFPTYAWGMPRIVTDFVNKLVLSNTKYLFAITTCVAVPGNTLCELQKALKKRGGKLNAGFAVKAGRSSLMKLNSFDTIMMKLDNTRFHLKTGEERLSEIIDTVINQRNHKPETSNRAANIFGSMLHNMGLKSFKTKDSEFEVRDECKGCGNCEKICPRGNITIESGRPVFHNNCELCHACIQWCSSFAIRHKDFDINPVQYHNNAIKLKQMILR